jgi:isopenicillin N synthase-like dioxygenase
MSSVAAVADAGGAVPVIDVADLQSEDIARRRAVAAAIGHASATTGFFYIVNHGVAPAVIDAAVDASRRFFAQPLAERMRIAVAKSNRGYTPLFDAVHGDQKPDATEGFELGFEDGTDAPPSGIARLVQAPNRWPALANFREPVMQYYHAALASSIRLLRGYALHFGVAEDFFSRHFTRPVADMRLAHYPVSDAVRQVSEFGTGAHTDHGIITVLWQDDCGGLEVCLPDGRWAGVAPLPGSLVVNIGELMTRWTNGRLKSTLHRVVNRSGRDRFSIPLFVHPNADTLVDPSHLPGVSETTRNYPPVISGEYLIERFSQYRASWADKAATEAAPA